MNGGEDTSRPRVIPVEHPERLMARLRGWDPVDDPFGSGLLRSFQNDMFSFFEPFTPPFTDTGYIRPQMLDSALFGYNPFGHGLRTDQENIAQENVSPQPQAQVNVVSLISESGVTKFESDQQPVTEDYARSAVLDSRRDTDLKQDNVERVDSNVLDSRRGTDLKKDNVERVESSDITRDDEIDDELDTGRDGDVDTEKSKSSIDKTKGLPINLPTIRDADVEIGNDSVDVFTGLEATEETTQKGGTEIDEDVQENTDLDNVQGTHIRNEEDRTDSGFFHEESDLNANQDEETVPETFLDVQSRQENAYISGLDINDQDLFGGPGIVEIPLDLHSLQANTYEILNTDMEFRVNMDVMHFKPEEIEIRVENNRITIHGRHAERQDDHGLVEREFTRIYTVPEDADPDHVTSCLYANGVLTVRAPKRKARITAN